MNKQKISLKRGCFFLTFGTMVIMIALGTILYYSKKYHDDSENELRRLYKANFLENVEFQGDILHIENLGWKYRGLVSICIKLKEIQVDSSKIIEGNSFFALDDIFVEIIYKSYTYKLDKRSLGMNKVHLNKNWNRKLMLYSPAGDSIDITSDFIDIGNSKNSSLCRDFIQ